MSEFDFRVVVLSGPSGSGKTTVVNRILRESPVKLVKSISATTRSPRENEVDGEDYYFLSTQEFQKRLDGKQFLEYAEVHRSGNYYGTLYSEMERAKQSGGWSLLEVDVEGTMSVLEKYPDAITLFLMTSSEEEYEKRLRSRGTESEAVIQKRLETARKELQSADQYQYKVINDKLENAVREIGSILESHQASCGK